MEGFIIFVLLVIIWIMYSNKRDADDKEKERLYPGYIERRDKINRINHRLGFIAEKQKKAIKNAAEKGEKICFWTHTYPKKQGFYQVQYQDMTSESSFDNNILYYQGVLYHDDWNNYDYNDEHVFPKLLKKTAYWDGVRYDVKNVRYYLFEIK